MKAGEADIEREVQLQEAAMLEIEAAIDRLQCLESIDRPRKRRPRALERREPPRHETIDSSLPASRKTKGEWGRPVERAQHERKTKELEHQATTIDGYSVPLDGGVSVNKVVGSYGDAHVVEP